MSTSRPRPFRSDLPLHRKGGPSTVNTEDTVLTRYLTRELKAARSLSLRPSACPYCQSHSTTLISRQHARMPMPTFRCTTCGRKFNRLTGTPLARLRHADKLYKFVGLLSCQLSYKEAAEILQVDYSAIANWAEKFRTWLLELDPSGAWEARVLLGIKPRPVVACPNCHKYAHVRFFGFHDDIGGRRLVCRKCELTFTVRDTADGLAVRTVVAYDPRTSRLHASKDRRK